MDGFFRKQKKKKTLTIKKKRGKLGLTPLLLNKRKQSDDINVIYT